MSRFGRLVAVQLVVSALALVVADASPRPLELVRQSILARADVDFSGIRTVVAFADGEKVRGVQQKIDCDAPENLRIVILAPEAEHGRLCLTSGRNHWEYNPHTRRAVHLTLPRPETVIESRLQELEGLCERMRLQYAGTDQIAGRRSHVIKVLTPDGLPVKKIWLDDTEHIELKTQRFDTHGNVKSSAYFTRIDLDPMFTEGLFEFSPPDDAVVIETEKPASRVALKQAEQQAGFDAVLPGYLPPGYRFMRKQTAVIDVSGRPTIWLTFSNGADTFSLFERRADGDCPSAKGQSCITWEQGGYHFTLMGMLAADEVEKVRESIRP